MDTTVRSGDRQATSSLIDRIERVDLRVTDVDKALGFYRDVVGLQVTGSSAGSPRRARPLDAVL
jgi:catechol-2,3-dioxygenase